MRKRKAPSGVPGLAAGLDVEGADDIVAGDALAASALVERYTAAKRRSSSIASWLCAQREVDREAYLEGCRVRRCWSWMLLRDYYRVERRVVAGASSCDRHLLCPTCAIRRARRFLAAYLAKFRAVSADQPDLLPYLVTLTIKNGPELSERYGHLRNLVSTLLSRRRDVLKKGWGRTEWARLEGALISFEFTRGKDGGWHPHVHALAFLQEAPDDGGTFGRWPALAAEVRGITGDSYIVDARPVVGDPVTALCEVAKYALKFSTLAPADTWEAYQRLRRRRLVESFGVLRGVKIPDDDDDDAAAEDLEGEPYVEELFRWFEGAYASRGRRTGPGAGEDGSDAIQEAPRALRRRL